MHKSIEKLAYKIAETVQGDLLTDVSDKVNIYHRKVSSHTSTDLAFTNGVITGGLRATALISSEKNSGNYSSFLSSLRQHLPVIINLDRLDQSIRGFESLNCFIFVASNIQEHIHYSILAQKVAELSLVPGIVVANYLEAETRVELPADNLLKKYLGNSDDYIETPTPSQRIIFGPKRRRIPNWFNPDLPVMLGAEKVEQARVFETMASESYFTDHLQDIITRAIAEFKAVFGTDLSLLSTIGKTANGILVSNSGLVIDNYNTLEARKIPALLKLNQVKPFPEAELKEMLGKAQSLTLLEHAELGGSASMLAQNLKANLPNLDFYFGRLGTSLSDDSLHTLSTHMQENKMPKEYFVESSFTKTNSPYPKHEILLQEIGKQYPLLKNAGLGTKANKPVGSSKDLNIPHSVREHLDKGPAYSKLSTFYDNIAFFYQQEEEEELVADPFAALPLTPAGSAGFFNSKTEINLIPHFRPAKCTGCGDCFVQCPHAALPPSVIGIEQLMRAGMDLATAKGNKLLKLTPMLKNLAKVAGKSVGEKTELITDFLPQAFESLCNQMKLDGDNLDAARNEFALVIEELKTLPVAITETFFNSPEAIEKGSGELFALSFNPSTCTGCGICSEACPEEAINMVEDDQDLISEAQQAFKLWETLPTTNLETIERLQGNNEYNQLATILLPKQHYASMTGGSQSEDFNAYKTLVHLVTATAESIAAPKRQSLIRQINTLIENISENVHESLSNTLPKENLDLLAATLRETRSQKASIHEIVDRLDELGQTKMVDTRALQRKTDLVDALKELNWVLTDGPTGVGRANYGLYFTGSNKMAWAQQYPLNNFAAPAVVQWQSSAPEQALGLINSHLRHQIDNLKLIRRAELEAAGKYDPATHDLEIATLDWPKLTVDERSSIPPVILIGEREDINASGWQSLAKLLESELPIKIILLDHIAPPSTDAVTSLTQSYTGLLNAIVMKRAMVFQGAINEPAHLAKGLQNGLSVTKPALLNLYAFSEAEHGAETTQAQAYANLAVNSRAFPLLYFNPDKEHGFLNGSIDLDANKATREDWITEDLILPNEESLSYKVTWADWAYTQNAWRSEFKKVSEDGNNVVMAEYIGLSVKDRAKKIPIIVRAGAKGLIYYSASRSVVQMTEAVLDNWNTLQELAGLITEFPVKLSEEVKKELTNKFDQDIAELKKEYDERLKEKEAEFMGKMQVQVRERLIQLSKMAKN